MASTLKAAQSNVINGLGSWTHTVATTAMYTAQSTTSVHLNSGLIVTIAQSGSTTATISSAAPAASQREIELRKIFNCVAGDVITFTYASSTPVDNGLNNVKSIAKVNAGTI